ncbi:MAG TPA: hypothetical protein VG713_14320 [Pirellulales bacterium]|nr:hypothetical protein [Pirellulales bacterium]
MSDGANQQLFNLAEDLSEKEDLAATETDRVKELTAKWQAWQAQMPPIQTKMNGRKNRANAME